MTVWGRHERLDDENTMLTTLKVTDEETVLVNRNMLERVLAEAGYLPGEDIDEPE
jgi:hypothetical protein